VSQAAEFLDRITSDHSLTLVPREIRYVICWPASHWVVSNAHILVVFVCSIHIEISHHQCHLWIHCGILARLCIRSLVPTDWRVLHVAVMSLAATLQYCNSPLSLSLSIVGRVIIDIVIATTVQIIQPLFGHS
jgi:hypothetical protein